MYKNKKFNFTIVKTPKEIQRKWDNILCRSVKTSIRHRESYYDIARFAIGEAFRGTREELQNFVISLKLNRMVEFTKYKNTIGHLTKNDFRYAIKRHNKRFINDLYLLGAPIVLITINNYGWKDLSEERIQLSERLTNESDYTYISKSSEKHCSDWKTIK